jgi:hypothetical protein
MVESSDGAQALSENWRLWGGWWVLTKRFAWMVICEPLERLVSPCWATHFFQSLKK